MKIFQLIPLNIVKYPSINISFDKRIMARRERFNANCANRTKTGKIRHTQKKRSSAQRTENIKLILHLSSTFLFYFQCCHFGVFGVYKFVVCSVFVWSYFSFLLSSVRFFYFVCCVFSHFSFSFVVRRCVFGFFFLLVLICCCCCWMLIFHTCVSIRWIFVFALEFVSSPLHTHKVKYDRFIGFSYMFTFASQPCVYMWFSTWALCLSVKIFAQKSLWSDNCAFDIELSQINYRVHTTIKIQPQLAVGSLN